MRYRQEFTLHARKTKSGKNIWYYQTYDCNGRRTTARSTGESSKAKASSFCMNLFRNGMLDVAGDPLFSVYAKDWWIPGECPFLKAASRRGREYSKATIQNNRLVFMKHIMPVFGKLRLSKINAAVIERWLFSFPENGYSNKTANNCLCLLRRVLAEARRHRLIPENPCELVPPLYKHSRERGILTREEARTLLNPDTAAEVWDNQILHYMVNLTAATTGLRLGELCALRAESVKKGYIIVSHSYSVPGGLKGTKTGKTREIPVVPAVQRYLDWLVEYNTEKGPYIFSFCNGRIPMNPNTIRANYYSALARIGITTQKRKDRYITFHSWRHYFNTEMRAMNVPDSKLRLLTGHSSEQMTNHYTHFQAEHMQDVVQQQMRLLG